MAEQLRRRRLWSMQQDEQMRQGGGEGKHVVPAQG